MNILVRILGCLVLVALASCGQGSQVRKLQSEQAFMQTRYDSLLAAHMDLATSQSDYLSIKHQLDKAEDALIQFYIKYENNPQAVHPNGLRNYMDSLHQANLTLLEENMRLQKSLNASKNMDPKPLIKDQKEDIVVDQTGVLRDSLNQQINEIEQLRMQNALLLQKLEYLNRLLSESKENQKTDRSESDEKKELTVAQKEINDLKQSIGSLNQKILQKNQMVDELNVKLSSNEHQRLVGEQKVAELKQQNERLQNEINLNSQKSNQNSEWQLQTEELKGKVLSKEKEILQLKDRILQQQSEIQKLEASSDKRNQVVLSDSLVKWKSQLAQLQKLHAGQAAQLDSLKESAEFFKGKQQFFKLQYEQTVAENLQLKEKLKSKPVPQPVNDPAPNLEKLQSLESRVSKILKPLEPQGCKFGINQHKLLVYIPHPLLFNVQSFAMTQEGTALLSEIQSAFQLHPTLWAQITGFSVRGKADSHSVDQMIRNAGTVFKLFSALGVSPARMKIAARYLSTSEQEHLPLQGIELEFETH